MDYLCTGLEPHFRKAGCGAIVGRGEEPAATGKLNCAISNDASGLVCIVRIMSETSSRQKFLEEKVVLDDETFRFTDKKCPIRVKMFWGCNDDPLEYF